ncbi:MAG: regulator of protease activity HflC (stomatin/prohibitin superfamily) [Myxococcota bacterium]|jgi:regulator of protease activity HflC (stomatin/prohibitin superfamily)
MSMVRSIIELFTLGAVQFTVVRQGEVRIIENRGKFRTVAQPGPLLLFSLWGLGDTIGRFTISQLARNDHGTIQLIPRRNVEIISTRMQVDDYPKESVISRDNATIFIDAVVYYRVMDPKQAVYEVQDYVSALQKLVQSALRDECGKYELDELLVSRDQINSRLRVVMDEATDPWGIKVDRVEIKDIDLGSFGKILAEQRQAETRRRTEITEAEGKKRAEILRAEGAAEARLLNARSEKEATVLHAEGAKTSQILAAEAEANATLKIRQAESEGFLMLQKSLNEGQQTERMLRLLQIQKSAEAASALAAGSATKIYLPADVTNLFGLIKGKIESA